MDSKRSNKSGVKTGTTTSSYVEAIRIDTRGCGVQGKLLAMIKNTGASWDMYYKIDSYPSDVDGGLGGLSIASKSETTIGEASTVTSTDVDKGYAAVVISVKSAESTPTTYQIDFTTY